MRNIVTSKFKQVNKTTALKLLEQGGDIYMLQSNMRPDNMWQSPCPIRYMDVVASYEYEYQKKTIKEIFETYIRDFEYYNCNSEQGYYVVFYISNK